MWIYFTSLLVSIFQLQPCVCKACMCECFLFLLILFKLYTTLNCAYRSECQRRQLIIYTYRRNCRKNSNLNLCLKRMKEKQKCITTHSKASNNDPDLLEIELCFIDTENVVQFSVHE